MENKSAKKILKVAVLLYLASFAVINWTDISWLFNYKEVYGIVSDFFNPYPSIDASTINVYFYPNHSENVAVAQQVAATPTVQLAQAQTQAQPVVKTNFTDKQSTLEIPKISVSVPIIFSSSTKISALEKDLSSGVVYYPGSVYPGQIGQIVILGHSAPPGWPDRERIGVFSNIDNLTVGDSILIDLNNKQYTYIVKQKTIIKRGAEVPVDSASAQNNVLTLISCWPPGKDYQRITIQAELQNS